MSRKRTREQTPKRALPSMRGFESPERTHRQPRAVMEKAPDQREKYRGMRARRNPELMQTKQLWMSPQLVFQKYGLRGILRSFTFELYDTGTGGLYTAIEVAQIRKVIMALNQASFTSGDQLLQLVQNLTSNMTQLVQTNLMELAEAFATFASSLRF